MKRIPILFEEAQFNRMRLRASQKGIPIAQLVRDLVARGLDAEAQTQSQCAKAALQGLVNLGKELEMSGPTDLSTNLDDYRYGDKE
jgi:hypothetical protein